MNARAVSDYFELESEVRSYCRRMDAVFSTAKNAEVWDEFGRKYIDFLSSCGALNYGHNNAVLKSKLVDYITGDGITTSMDLKTNAKRTFIASFERNILKPRGLNYKLQFPGPTGTNAVEAAFKLARKVTSRKNVVAFSNGFHGMTLGALSATSNPLARRGAGVPLTHVERLEFNSFEELRNFEQDARSALSKLPAAFVVETVQGEGGLNVATREWLQELERVAKRLGSLLIIDDIQAGCGRTGTFFSFENANLRPHIVCLSKSLSGYGLPFSLVLLQPDIDVWEPGEHNGTFRGNNHAFVTAAAAAEFWRDKRFALAIDEKARELNSWIESLELARPRDVSGRGVGLLRGIAFKSGQIAQKVAAQAVKNGVLIETCGRGGEVVKIMPPLTIELGLLREGLKRVEDAVDSVRDVSTKWKTLCDEQTGVAL